MNVTTYLSLLTLCIGGVTSTHAEPLAVNDQVFETRIDGNGSPVVFVHGALSDRRVWDDVMDAMPKSAQRSYISYTQRHFGPGKVPLGQPDDFRRDIHVTDLIAVVETLDRGPVTLVTWSYGGEIGIHAMLQRPDLFRAALHYEPMLFPLLADLPGGRRALQEKKDAVFAPAAALAKRGDLEGAAMQFIEGVFLMVPGTAVEAATPWPSIWRENSRTIPAYGTMAELPVHCADLHAIKVPMLVLSGADSQVDNVMIAEEVARCSSNATLVALPGINHDLPLVAAVDFAELIDAFLTITR